MIRIELISEVTAGPTPTEFPSIIPTAAPSAASPIDHHIVVPTMDPASITHPSAAPSVQSSTAGPSAYPIPTPTLEPSAMAEATCATNLTNWYGPSVATVAGAGSFSGIEFLPAMNASALYIVGKSYVATLASFSTETPLPSSTYSIAGTHVSRSEFSVQPGSPSSISLVVKSQVLYHDPLFTSGDETLLSAIYFVYDAVNCSGCINCRQEKQNHAT